MDKNFEIRDLRIKEKFFLDDLYLNGYARLCGIYATGVYLSLCRHADKQQQCYPSRHKIAEELAISEKQVGRAINILIQHNIVFRERLGKKLNNRYWLIDKSEWTTSPINRDYQSYHIGTDSPIHSKVTHIKDTHSKVAIAPAIADPINSLIELFKPINLTYTRLFKNKTQRESLKNLLKQFGEEKVKWAIQICQKTNTMKYAPVITTPIQLSDKLAQLIIFCKKESLGNQNYAKYEPANQ